MKTAAIIVEYNPFHNGHKYQIDTLKENFHNKVSVMCLMSSNFVQRGQPAITDKYARADMAISAGADLVIEYPSLYSCASAENFASNAVFILNSLNCVDYLCYGSNHSSKHHIQTLSKFLVDESDRFKYLLKTELKKGVSFASARQNALKDHYVISQNDYQHMVEILNSPNDILAVEYEKALIRLKSGIKSYPIQRIGSDYNEKDLKHSYSSATAIREAILNQGLNLDMLSENLPKTSIEIMERYIDKKNLSHIELFKDIIFYSILKTDNKNLKRYPLVSEGIENLLKKNVKHAESVEHLVNLCTTKRYPSSRIRRLLMHIATDTTAAMIKRHPVPEYARVIACKDKSLLSLLSEKSNIPVVTSLKKSYDSFDASKKELVEFENRSCEIYDYVTNSSTSCITNEFSVKVDI